VSKGAASSDNVGMKNIMLGYIYGDSNLLMFIAGLLHVLACRPEVGLQDNERSRSSCGVNSPI
jgi:hypothetical protein